MELQNNDKKRNPCTRFKNYLGKINWPLFVLVCLFAMSSWIDINMIWVELPLLVRTAPESWNLASYIVIVIQIANIGPLLFTILKVLLPNRVKEWPAILIVIIVGILSSILLIFFWDDTTIWVGINEYRSTGLLVLSLLLSLVDCTSSVLYFPYMSSYDSQYMTALFVGEGLSGLVPAILGLAQLTDEDQWIVTKVNVSEKRPLNNTNQISSNTSTSITVNLTKSSFENFSTETKPSLNESIKNGYETVWIVKDTSSTIYAKERFSISIYFLLIAILLTISLVSFLLIHFHPYFKRLRKIDQTSSTSKKKRTSSTTSAENESNTHMSEIFQISNSSLEKTDVQENTSSDETQSSSFQNNSSTKIDFASTKLYLKGICLLLITIWINGLTNGVLPALQTYSAQPYGSLAYNLHVKLSVLVNPLACLFALFVKTRRLWVIAILTTMASVLSGFQIALACLSPYPPLKRTENGIASVVATQVIMTAIFSYTKVNIATVMSKLKGKHWLLFFGGATQLGSLIGAIITFCLVNVNKVFKSEY